MILHFKADILFFMQTDESQIGYFFQPLSIYKSYINQTDRASPKGFVSLILYTISQLEVKQLIVYNTGLQAHSMGHCCKYRGRLQEL